MRIHGTLSRWNDERGFGFVTVPHNSEELFIHISAFPRDGNRPQVGELISFEIETKPDGKKCVTNIMRSGRTKTASKERYKTDIQTRKPTSRILAAIVIGIVAAYGFNLFNTYDNHITHTPAYTPSTLVKQPVATESPFRCDGRTHCSQMSSCDEARYFLKNCPDTKMDGDNDGEPCEQQWCN